MNDTDSIAIAVFVKTPGISPVKSRLAAEIGVDQAERCYRLSVRAIEEVLCRTSDASPIPLSLYWAVAESEGMTHPMWEKFARELQPVGNLGDRLAGMYDRLISRHRGVIFLGADAPQITPRLLLEGIRLLTEEGKNRSRCVIGPARDGGFYLFGGTSPLPNSVWTNISYSNETTCEQLCGDLSKNSYTCKFLPPLCDIDRRDDLLQVLDVLRSAHEGSAFDGLDEQRMFFETFKHLATDF
ncbi:MAG: DUF2064 domain-containing protein [Planctomycetaceae bacterium]